jgi:GGDEF domain-containing protein
MRRSDTLTRLGGDEFVVVLDDDLATSAALIRSA